MQYPNFDYAQLSPPSEPPEFDNYPSSPRILEYLEAFAEEHDLVARIRFKAKVNRLIPTHDHWTIHYGDKACASADAVVVCNGHYSVPNVPLLAGMDSFDGRLLHAREYIGPEGFSGQKVVVWGGNASALDLVREISGTASHLFWCGHAPAMSDIAADLARVSVCADPSRIAGSTVTLSSGEALEDVDVILMCTCLLYTSPSPRD